MPRLNFTDRSIASLKASLQRQEFWDESAPGFGIRVTPEGRKTWVYMYRVGARKRRLTVGTYPGLSLSHARERAFEAQYQLSKGVDPADQKKSDKNAETFRDLVDEYLERHAKIKKKSWAEDKRILEREFLPDWSHVKAKLVTRRDVIYRLDSIVERGSPILANKALAVLRKAFNFAIQRDIIEVNPCWNVPAPAKERTRDRILNQAELSTLWDSLGKEEFVSGAYYKLLLLTAQRSGELAGAEWTEVDLAGRCWTIPAEHAKNGLPHRVPLSNAALTLFKMLRLNTGSSRWIFPSPKGEHPIRDRKRRLRQIQRDTQIDFLPHDLRRTAASHMTGLGVPRLVVSKILNHVEQGVTKIYDRHSYDQEKREALEKWSNQLLANVSVPNEHATHPCGLAVLANESTETLYSLSKT